MIVVENRTSNNAPNVKGFEKEGERNEKE